MSMGNLAARPYVRRGPIFETPVGGKVRRDTQKRGYAWVKCPDCPKSKPARHVKIPHGGEELRKFTGRCPRHSNVSQRTLTGKHQHKSGATYDYDERDPEDTSHKAAFVCANVGQKPNCLSTRGEKIYGWIYQFQDEGWGGLCQNCLSEWRHQHTKKTYNLDLKDDPRDAGAPGTQIREDAQGHYSVTYWLCGCTVSKSRASIKTLLSAHRRWVEKRGGRPWPSSCRMCFNNPPVLEQKRLQAIAGNGDGQKNGSAEQRKQKREDEKLLKAVGVIATKWGELQILKRTHQQKLDMITKVEFARELGSKSQDEKNLESVANLYLTRLLVNKMFPGTPSWFRCFVGTVVEQIEKKTPAERIVSSLKSRLARSAV